VPARFRKAWRWCPLIIASKRLHGMSNVNAAAPAPSTSMGSALLVSNDAATIKQLSASMEQLAMSPEVCFEVPAALGLLSQRKFEAVIVDLRLGDQARAVLEKIRLSPANRTAVLFTISDSDAENAVAFKAGSNFVLRRPLSPAAIDRSLKVAYGLIVRERRRYFRCPVEIPAAIYSPSAPAVHGKTLNVSEGGVAINTSLALKPGVQVKVQFTLPDPEIHVEAESTVCWSKEGYLGFQFTSVSPQLASELQEWLSRRLEESLPESVTDKFRSLGQAPDSTEGHPGVSNSGVMESSRRLKVAIESQNWVVLYRAAVSEPDIEKRLAKIELAERNMKQRWNELVTAGPEAAEERQRLKDAIDNMRGLRAGSH
jgi:CheY-like chemotaxis protein